MPSPSARGQIAAGPDERLQLLAVQRRRRRTLGLGLADDERLLPKNAPCSAPMSVSSALACPSMTAARSEPTAVRVVSRAVFASFTLAYVCRMPIAAPSRAIAASVTAIQRPAIFASSSCGLRRVLGVRRRIAHAKKWTVNPATMPTTMATTPRPMKP